MWSDAYAQAGTPAAANPTLGMLIQYFPIVIMVLVMWLLVIRPAQQRQKKVDQMLRELKKGDRVLTSGGIIGTVIGIDDAKAILKIADDVKVEFTKGSITQVLTAGEAKS